MKFLTLSVYIAEPLGSHIGMWDWCLQNKEWFAPTLAAFLVTAPVVYYGWKADGWLRKLFHKPSSSSGGSMISQITGEKVIIYQIGMEPEMQRYLARHIEKLEDENKFLKTSNAEIEKKIAASAQARLLHEKTTKELEERLDFQGDSDALKAQAYGALERKDYDTTVKLLIESAKEDIQKVEKIEKEEYIITRINESGDENKSLETFYTEIVNNLASTEEKQLIHEKITNELEERLTLQKGSDALKAQAREALERKDYDTAVKLLMESAKENIQKVAETFYDLAKAETLRLNYKKALEYYELAARTQPDNALYLNDAGIANNTMGFYDNAITHCENALEIYNTDNTAEQSDKVACYNTLGSAYYKKR